MHGLLQVDAPQARERLDAGTAWLVDVRERSEIARLAFDLPGVVEMPLSEFERRFRELPGDRELIMACASGARSFQAMQYLIHHGFRHVANLQGGIGHWRLHGQPVRMG